MVAKRNPTSEYENKLDQQISHWKTYRDTLTKALRYIKERGAVEQLIEKYTMAAEMASNYLYNDYSIKFSKIGGYRAWQIKQWERQQERLSGFNEELQNSYLEYFESDEFSQLSELEQKHIKLEFKSKFEEIDKQEPPEFTNDFTMVDLYKILNLDYNLVYES